MKGELISFNTKDNYILDGFLIRSKNKSRKAAIFIHGLCSRVEPGKLKTAIAETFQKLNYSFLMFNNRGFGTLNKINSSKKKGKPLIAGGARESFKDCIYDIQAAINYLKKQNITHITLVGHSTGCQKIIYYLTKTSKKPDKSIKSIILLAPANDAEAWLTSTPKEELNKLLNKADRLIKADKPDEFVTFLSAKRFFNLLEPNSIEGNLLNYQKPNQKNIKSITKIKIPIFTAFGSREQYVTKGQVQHHLNLIQSSYQNKKSIIVKIPYGDHSFRNHTDTLSKEIIRWVNKL